MNSFGNRVKQRRIELGLTQEDLAKKVGLSGRSTVNKWENDQNGITQSKIMKLANALDVSPDYFFIDNEEEKKEAEKRGFPTSLETFQNDLLSAGFPVQEYLSLSPEARKQAMSSFRLIILGLANQNK